MKPTKRLSLEETLRVIGDGACQEDLTSAIERVTETVSTGGKGAKGKVTLTLTFARVARGQVQVQHDVKAAVPPPPRETSIFFVRPEGGLTRENPGQPSFEDQLS